MKYKVLFLEELDISGKQILWDNGVEIVVADGHSEDIFVKEIREHQVGVTMYRTEVATPVMMDASSNLKVTVKHGVGLNNVDVEYAAKKSIQAVYAPLGNYNSVVEYVIMLMLVVACRYKHVDREFRNGSFDIRYTLQGTFELEGLTLGASGCSRTGQTIANKTALGFGMNATGYDPYARQESMEAPVKLLENGDDMLARADLINLNLSSLPSIRGNIDYTVFQKMKPKAFFINCSCGDVVVGADLTKALQEGLILGTGLDVFDEGPIEYTNPMLEMDNMITTPHTVVTTRQVAVRCCTTAARGIMEVMNGRPITLPGNEID